MTTEALPGNINVQHTRVESRKLQAEFLQGNMIDNAPMSMPGFPKASGDERNVKDYAASIVICFPLSIWRC
jgi:hypothetical protein